MSNGEVVEDQELTGLAGARTDLAWSRSGLAVLACLAAIAKRILPEFSTLDARAVLIAALAVGAIAWVFGFFWAHVVAVNALTGRRIADARTLRLVASGTAALGIVATILALLPAQ
jgi:hypothetical protein